MGIKTEIDLFNWQLHFDDLGAVSLGDDIILLDKPHIESVFYEPFKIDVVTAIICLSGRLEGFINMNQSIAEASSLTLILPGQILQHKSTSDDFEGMFIVMSQKFINSLNVQTDSSLYYSISDNPSIHLSPKKMNALIQFYNMLKSSILDEANPYRLKTIKHLTKAFFYGTSYSFHKQKDDTEKTKHEMIVDSFLELVKKYYKQERSVTFYASKLCITPKYLSYLVKTNTSQSANDWINKFVILEAKALLRSTHMTIEQISDELHFSSQSFFGKYFKRITKLSPRDYKQGSTYL